MRSGGRTSEQGADSATPHIRAIADQKGRVIILMTHNTDIGDSWEREGDDPSYFVAFGPKGYALASTRFCTHSLIEAGLARRRRFAAVRARRGLRTDG
jgi:hypothetical protein